VTAEAAAKDEANSREYLPPWQQNGAWNGTIISGIKDLEQAGTAL